MLSEDPYANAGKVIASCWTARMADGTGAAAGASTNPQLVSLFLFAIRALGLVAWPAQTNPD